MTADPKIPYGHKQVFGQLQRGDGIWDETKQRFVKVKKCYPTIGLVRLIAIRKCEVVQPPLPGTEEAAATQTITVHDGQGKNPRHLNRAEYEHIKASGMLWEYYPDAPLNWPEDTLVTQPAPLPTETEPVATVAPAVSTEEEWG